MTSRRRRRILARCLRHLVTPGPPPSVSLCFRLAMLRRAPPWRGDSTLSCQMVAPTPTTPPRLPMGGSLSRVVGSAAILRATPLAAQTVFAGISATVGRIRLARFRLRRFWPRLLQRLRLLPASCRTVAAATRGAPVLALSLGSGALAAVLWPSTALPFLTVVATSLLTPPRLLGVGRLTLPTRPRSAPPRRSTLR